MGDTVDRTTPAVVLGLFTWAAAVTAGSGHSCVLMADGVTARVVSAEEFDRLPRAGPVTPSGP